MGLETKTYVGPVLQIRKSNIRIPRIKKIWGNKEGEEFQRDHVYDPKTGEELGWWEWDHTVIKTYESWMKIFDDADKDPAWIINRNEVNEDTFVQGEMDGAPSGYFYLFPNLPVTGSETGSLEKPEDGTIALDQIDRISEITKFEAQYQEAIKFLQEFMGPGQVQIRFIATTFTL